MTLSEIIDERIREIYRETRDVSLWISEAHRLATIREYAPDFERLGLK